VIQQDPDDPDPRIPDWTITVIPFSIEPADDDELMTDEKLMMSERVILTIRS
jgi:hypothetical protein